MAAQKIRIGLMAYEHATLDQSTAEIVRVVRETGGMISGPVPLPTTRRMYTVLRSPHIDKKSREQFEILTHKRLIDITNSSQKTLDALMDLDLPGCVDISIKVE